MSSIAFRCLLGALGSALLASSAYAQTNPPPTTYPAPAAPPGAASYPPPPAAPSPPPPATAAPPAPYTYGTAPAAPVAPPPAQYGAPAAAPAPSAQDQASTDHDTPQSGPAQDFRIYRPTPDERLLAPPPPHLPVMLSVLEDTHGFVSGSIRGFGSETRLRFGANQGVTIGTYNFNTLEVGYDGFRYSGVKVYEPSTGPGLNVFLLIPNLDVRAFVSGSRAAMAIGTSVSGVRLAKCIDTRCVEVSLRLLTLDAWYAGDFHGASPAFSVGAGLSAGLKI